jgi:ACS family glucarate transporter-like MFS transporter
MTRYRWRIVLVLFVMAVALYVDRVNISVAAPSFARELGLSQTALGAVFSAFLIGYAIGLIPGGYLADRVGPQRLLTAAGLFWGMTTASVACIPRSSPTALTALIAARFLLGLCEACAFPTFNRVIANWMLPGERATASGWLHCGAGIGGALTPPLVAAVVAEWGWRTAFLLSGILTCSVALWWYQAATDHPADNTRVSEAERSLIAKGHDDGSRPLAPNSAWYRRALQSPEAWLLSASEFCFGIAGFVFATWFYTYLVQVRGAGALHGALLAATPYLAIAIGSPLGGFLSDRGVRTLGAPWGRRTVPLISISLSGVALAIAPLIAGNAAATAMFALAAGLLYVAAPSFWSTLIDVTQRGTGVLGGAMNGSKYLGSAIATALFPLLVPRIGWTSGLQCVSIAAFTSGLLWLGINSSHRIDDDSHLAAS